MSTEDDVLVVDLNEVPVTAKNMPVHYMRKCIIEIISKEIKHKGIEQIYLCCFNTGPQLIDARGSFCNKKKFLIHFFQMCIVIDILLVNVNI